MMATYYPTLSSQSDNSQCPYSGDQKLGFYSELPSFVNNMIAYNQASAAGQYPEIVPGSTLSFHTSAEFPSTEARNEMAFFLPVSDAANFESIDGRIISAAGNPVGNSVDGDSHAVRSTQLDILDGECNFHRQGLSLCLGSQVQSVVPVTSLEHHFPSLWSTNPDSLLGYDRSKQQAIKIEGPKNPQDLVNIYESSGYANTILKSKYLKAAQQLLDESVNVKEALKKLQSNGFVYTSKDTDGRSGNQSIVPKSVEMSSGLGESVANASSELSPAEREDFKNKKNKLLSMLDEVDKRYNQYCHHMHTMVSSFDMVAGHGATKSYTALARQTISAHFRCLRDAISGQIEVIRRRLSEEDNSPSSQVVIRRLRYVDCQVRQQRALQQLGVTQHAWRPQRGLPESSVSILRAWLFEHFLHPYPNETEKRILARQTGLKRNQVANWFINARVRLWKPMVEEMYQEEFGDLEANSKSSLDNATNTLEKNHLASENRPDKLQDSLTSTTADNFLSEQVHDLKSNHMPDPEMNKPITGIVLHHNSQELKVADSQIMTLQCNKPDENVPSGRNVDRNHKLPSIDMMLQLRRFTVGSQVSLALGLQYHESNAFPLCIGTDFTGNNIAADAVGHEAVDYLVMDPIKQQDRFGNSHLLHDFAV